MHYVLNPRYNNGTAVVSYWWKMRMLIIRQTSQTYILQMAVVALRAMKQIKPNCDPYIYNVAINGCS
jgi:hypothetical protein